MENLNLIPEGIKTALSSTTLSELNKLSTDNQTMFLEEYNKKGKSISVAYILSLLICFGVSGIHYAYLGNWGLAALSFFTLGGCGWWTIVDLFRMKTIVNNVNNDIAKSILRDIKIMTS